MTELEIAVKEWLIALRQMGRSSETIEKYRWHLARLETWLGKEGVTVPEQITKSLLRQWGAGLYDSGCGWSPATIRQAIFAVRGFLQWCREEEIVNEPLVGVLRVPKVKARVQRTLDIEEIGQLIRACDDLPLGLRNAALVSLLVDSGLRASEVCRLEIGDMQVGMKLGSGFVNVVAVQGKGGATLPAYFGQATSERLDCWFEVRRAQEGVGNVFVGLGGIRPGTALTRHGLKNILSKMGERAGVPKVGPHALRRAFAVLAHQAGGSSRQIQQWGRWSSMQMVERYTMAYEAGRDYAPHSPMDYVGNQEPVT